MGISVITSGLFVAVIAVLFVVGRVLWPKEWFQQRVDARRFDSSVREMRDGLAMLDQERYADALQRFKEAAAKTPRKPAPSLLRIYALGLQGQRGEAMTELRQARQRWSAKTLPFRLLALAQLGAGEYDRAYQSAQTAAAEVPVVAPALRTLGDVCRLLERYPEAERAYRGAIQLGAPRPYAGLAWVLAGQGDIAGAEAELSSAPSSLFDLFEARLTLGQIHLQARRLDDALSIFRVLRREHGDVPRVLVPFGTALLEARRFDEAFQVLNHAVEVSGADPFAHAALARYYVEVDDLANAMVHIRSALKFWTGYGVAHSIFGDALKRASNYAAAKDQYIYALEQNPFLAETHDRLATLLRHEGAIDQANEHQREAERLRPAAPRELTQESLAVTTSELAAIRPEQLASHHKPTTPPPQARNGANGHAPRSYTSPKPPQVPAALSRPPAAPSRLTLPRRGPDDVPANTPPPQQPAQFAGPASAARRPPAPGGMPSSPGYLRSDITVFPGATLLADESRESVFMQTLQTARTVNEVLDYYRQRMRADGWWLMHETDSTLPHLEGKMLHFMRDGQEGTVTVGHRPMPNRQNTRAATYIVTQFTHLRTGEVSGHSR